jgi:hypothetical protein
MSLFSTIAHDGAAPARGFSLKRIGMMAAGLALGVGIGFVIINSRTVAEPSATAKAPATGLAYDDFVRLNTTDLDNLVPAASAAATGAQALGDPTVPWWNTEAFKNLVPGASAAATETQVLDDPSVPYWSTERFKNLVPAASAAVNGSQSVVDSNFLYRNIASLEYPVARYSEQPSGPR